MKWRKDGKIKICATQQNLLTFKLMNTCRSIFHCTDNTDLDYSDTTLQTLNKIGTLNELKVNPHWFQTYSGLFSLDWNVLHLHPSYLRWSCYDEVNCASLIAFHISISYNSRIVKCITCTAFLACGYFVSFQLYIHK